MLVAAVKRINITPADLSTLVSVLITISSENLNSVDLSHTYIRRHFNKITKAVCFTIRQTLTVSKNFFVYWNDKINSTYDGTLKEKRLSVFVSGKEHKLLRIPSLVNNFRNIYG